MAHQTRVDHRSAVARSVGNSKALAAGENHELARLLDEAASLLEVQNANPFRVQAYVAAAGELRELAEPVRQVWERGGRAALIALPHIGESLSRAIETWLSTGTLGILRRLRGEESTERLLMTVDGVGRELAHRIHHLLGISTLEELETAARDGRLLKVSGVGEGRARAIGDQLETRLRHSRRYATGDASDRGPAPVVSELLDVDAEYRKLAKLGRLPKIAPRRFNPEGEAWLPILHTHRGHHHYTVLFSNTARAHDLDKTRDWVIIYRDDGLSEKQWTVVTEPRGPLAGQRVVRGLESECMKAYSR